MKQFRFQLEPVLDYKTQALDALQVELNTAQALVAAQERQVDEARKRLTEYDADYSQRKQDGMTIIEAMECESCRVVLQRRLRQEQEKLRRLEKLAEDKRNEVVEARKETHSLEKLKEIRKKEYHTALAKAEEKQMDDLTAARRVAVAG